VDVVVAEAGANQLLHEERLLIGAARRGDAADGVLAVLRLNALELASRVIDRLLPAHLLPRIGDLGADHGLQDALPVGGIAPGETAFYTGMAAVRLAVLVRHHTDQLLAAHLGLERTADATIGAGGDDRMFRLADLDHLLLVQRRGRTGLHAGTAGDAF